MRAITRARWDALNEECLVCKQSLVDEVARAETEMDHPDHGAPDHEHSEPTARPHLQTQTQTQTAPSTPYPFDCLIFVHNVHSGTNKATLKSLFAQAFQDQDGSAHTPTAAGLDYVDFNKGMDLSDLSVDTTYSFQLVLRTTAGTFPSNLIRLRTHTIADTSGISVSFGTVADEALLQDIKTALKEMRAKWSDRIQIDTTHFVCTTPAMTPMGANASGSNVLGGSGVESQQALQLSIPVVQPQWILACLVRMK
jgi:hypothetical protein